ncbi:MAG: hypothetical protein ACD_75C01917G0001 [uncultured bacterium]|nr:MAG: hypothetical protein ACD_75C01917G0001 [uncultured bacterium]
MPFDDVVAEIALVLAAIGEEKDPLAMKTSEAELAVIKGTVSQSQGTFAMDDIILKRTYVLPAIRASHLPIAMEFAVAKLTGILQAIGGGYGSFAVGKTIFKLPFIAAIWGDKHSFPLTAVTLEAFAKARDRHRVQQKQ